MKKYVITIVLLCFLSILFVARKDLYRIYLENFYFSKNSITLGEKNQFYRDENFEFVQQTSSFIPKTRKDILNIYYTIINAGKKTFHFYCPKSYKNCIDDVKEIANDQTLLSHINNFVHPFNGFKNIATEYDQYGEVTISIEYTYDQEKIKAISLEKNRIEQAIWTNNMNTQEKILKAHDYIIHHTHYDKERTQNDEIKYDSDTAYGALIEGYALCGGYTDAMALFLEDLGIKNNKISSENHVWNALELNHQWYHLDLTWDDPIMSDGSEVIEHHFFLITTRELKSIQDPEHDYQQDIYLEVS